MYNLLSYISLFLFFVLLWPPYVIGQAIIFLPCGLFLSFFFLLLFCFSSSSYFALFSVPSAKLNWLSLSFLAHFRYYLWYHVVLWPFYDHYIGQPVLAGTTCYELRILLEQSFFCPPQLADGNRCIGFGEKMLEILTTKLRASSPYCITDNTAMTSV